MSMFTYTCWNPHTPLTKSVCVTTTKMTFNIGGNRLFTSGSSRCF